MKLVSTVFLRGMTDGKWTGNFGRHFVLNFVLSGSEKQWPVWGRRRIAVSVPVKCIN